MGDNGSKNDCESESASLLFGSVNERMRMIADKRNDIRMFSEYQVSNVVSFLQFKRIRLL